MSFFSDLRPWQRAGLRITGSALALIVLFHFLPLGEVWAALQRLPAHLWLLAVAGYLVAHFIGLNKWRLVVNTAGAGLSFWQAVRCYFAGLFSTLLLPSIVGGDVVRTGLALRFGRSKTGLLLGSFLDRVLDFAALVILAALGAWLVPGTLNPSSRRVFVIVSIAILVLGVAAALIIFCLPARKFSYRMRRRLVCLRESGRSMLRQPQYVVSALSLGLVVQASFIWLTSQVADACGLRLMFRAWLFAWPLAKLSAIIPVTQGGIGVREAALAALLVPFGARAVLTVAVGLAWEAIIICGGLIAGATSFLVGHFAPRARVGAAVSAPGVSSEQER